MDRKDVNTTHRPPDILQGLGPQIVGGESGSLMFDASGVTAAGELLLDNQTDASDAVSELSDMLGSSNETEVEKGPLDASFKSLFDLVPLFQGIQSDSIRQRAVVGRCVLNVNQIVTASICAATNSSGNCTRHAVKPMSDAMFTLWKNAQSVYCKYNPACEASLCYKYPGAVDADGLAAAQVETFTNQPLWIQHNATAVENKTVSSNTTMVQQYVNFTMALEKIVLCEQLSPPRQTASAMVQTRNCHTSRRCKMERLTRGHCVDATSAKSPPTTIPCPVDTEYNIKLKLEETKLTSILCSQA